MKVIGALHLAPLIGYEGHPGRDEVLRLALADLRTLQDGGVDAVIVENNYDLPHRVNETPEAIAMFADILDALKRHATVPLGISVLWNDYASALMLAHLAGATFIRVPVFVDSVQTAFGTILADPQNVMAARGSARVRIYADVQVKHAKMLAPRPMSESVADAMRHGADGVIITGAWTGTPPSVDDLQAARNAGAYVIIGSGASAENIGSLPADAVIVSTSLKEDAAGHERNMKPFEARIEKRRVEAFVRAAREQTGNPRQPL